MMQLWTWKLNISKAENVHVSFIICNKTERGKCAASENDMYQQHNDQGRKEKMAG